jgi:hypothetical protein
MIRAACTSTYDCGGRRVWCGGCPVAIRVLAPSFSPQLRQADRPRAPMPSTTKAGGTCFAPMRYLLDLDRVRVRPRRSVVGHMPRRAWPSTWAAACACAAPGYGLPCRPRIMHNKYCWLGEWQARTRGR